jgi:hypothetical protein
VTNGFASLTSAQIEEVQAADQAYKIRMASGDLIGAAFIVANLLIFLGRDVAQIIRAQSAVGWPTPVLMGLARMVQSV